MTARRTLDWAKVKAILAPQDFNIVSAQRQRHTELTRILATPLPKIDFEHYRSALANKDVVNQTEAALKGFKPSKVDAASVLKSLDEQEAAAVQHAKETVTSVTNTVGEFQKSLDNIKKLPHYDQLTPDVIYESTPGLEAVYHDRLRQGKIYHDDHNFGEKFFG